MKTVNNERGVALILSLLVLVALTLMGMAAIMTSTLDIKIASNEKTAIQAQYAAEAGIGEAIARLNVPTTDSRYIGQATDPLWVNNTPGNLTIWKNGFRRTLQTSDGKTFFNYTVNVKYKPLPSDTSIVAFYNKTSGYSNSPYESSGRAVYQITATGYSGNYNSKVVLDLAKVPYTYNIKGGISANGALSVSGNSSIDGSSHNINGALCSTNPTPACSCTFTNLTGAKPWAYSGDDVGTQGNPDVTTTASPAFVENGSYSLAGPWEALGLDKDAFDETFTNTKDMPYSGSLNGEIYVQGHDTWNIANGLSGNGILIVHNPDFVPGVCADEEFDGNPSPQCDAEKAPAELYATGGTYNGIIIADKVDLRGNVIINGAVISLTTIATTIANGTPTINYSCDAIETLAGGKPKKKLSWNKEMN